MALFNIQGTSLCRLGLRCVYSELRSTFIERKISARTSGIIGARSCSIDAWDKPLTPKLRKKIDKHWRDRLPRHNFDENSDKEKFYILSMIPYPSGCFHMGHARIYCLSDAIARYHRMQGKNVLHPISWDAFGLPAENAALEGKLDPDRWTQAEIANMKKVMEILNLSFDWDREFATCDSDYYKWTQFFFLKLLENDLVYRKKCVVNWDPIDQTVLADEQIDENGKSRRSGAVVEKKLLAQWFIRITKFSKELYEGLNDPEIIKNWEEIGKIQKNYMGKCNGSRFDFQIEDPNSKIEYEYMPIWLKNPEYIDKAKFVAVLPNSMWDIGSDPSNLLPYKVINPITGEALPVYVTQTVDYPDGSDNHLGIPEMIEIDKCFAESVNISVPPPKESVLSDSEWLEYREKICAEARIRGIGGYETSPRIKDWLISRQRYWGTPIPVVHCKKCDVQPVPESDLPIKLPKVKRIEKGKNNLEEVEEWCMTSCPKCGGDAVRDTDTLDTFVDTSWYYLRYLDPDNVNAAFSVDKARKFLPVDLYIGGKEQTSVHLYYVRFFNYFLRSAGLLINKEPFKRLLPLGMVKGQTFKSSKTNEYVFPNLVLYTNNKAVHVDTQENLIVSWEKMSKLKYNAVKPSDMINEYSADTTRLIILSEVPPRIDRNWSERNFPAIFEFQNKLWETIQNLQDLRSRNISQITDEIIFKKDENLMKNSRNYYTNRITKCFDESYNINIAISCMQGLIGNISTVNEETVALGVEYEKALASLIIFLAPVAPCFASELWAGFLKASNRLCKTGEINWDVALLDHHWPKCDGDYVEGEFEAEVKGKKVWGDKKKGKKKEEKTDSKYFKENRIN